VDSWLAAYSSGAAALRSPGASGPVPLTEEFLDPPALMKETLLMGFRYTRGPDAAAFRRRFRCTLEEAIPQSLGAWRNRGLLRQDRAALNREGLLFLNPFLLDVFGEVG
jgi:oxygen-independent coproporphyrinogen-3 oxidase